MSEENVTIKGVQRGDICEVKISGAFMQRIQGAYFAYIKLVGVDTMNQIAPHLKDGTIEDIEDHELRAHGVSIEALLILLHEIEHQFDTKSLIKEVPVDNINED